MVGLLRKKQQSWLRQPSFIDGLAAAIALIAAGGVLWSPKLSNAVARATGDLELVQLQVDTIGLPLVSPESVVESALAEGSLAIVIRNQPSGRVKIIRIEQIKPSSISIMPESRVLTLDNLFSHREYRLRFHLKAEARISDSGIILAGTKLKIGVPISLEGLLYHFKGNVSGITLP